MTLVLLCPLALAQCASAPAVERNPYTADQIVRLLRGAVSPDRVLHDAARECISFDVTSDLAQQFMDAGASRAFVNELSQVCRLAPRPPSPSSDS